MGNTSKDVAKKGSTAVGQVLDYGEFAGSGLEGVSSDEMVIPFINVLQALSPEVDDRDDCKAGMLFNKGTQEPIPGDEGFLFLPVARQLSFVEWVPRKQGGGLVGRHDESAEIVRAAKKACAERGEDPRFTLLWTGEPEKSNELRQTYYLYGFILEQTGEEDGKPVYEAVGQALMSFNGTKIKVYKNWLTPINMLKGKPPIFAHPTRVSTFKDGNSKGEFYNFRLRPANGTLTESLLDPARESDLALLKAAHKFSQDIAGEKYKMGDEGEAGGPGEEDVPF